MSMIKPDPALEFARGNAPKAVGRPMSDAERDEQWNKPDHQYGVIDKSMALTVPTPNEMESIITQGKIFFASKMFPSLKSPEAVAAVILTGREMGLTSMASLRGIEYFADKIFIKPMLMHAVCENSGQLTQWDMNATRKEASVTVRRANRKPKTYKITIEDARLKGWTERNKANYDKQPDTMLRHRVTGMALRDQFPDYFMGMGLLGHETIDTDDLTASRAAIAGDLTDAVHEMRHVNDGEVVPAETIEVEVEERQHPVDDDEAAIDAEQEPPVSEFIDDETAMKAEDLCAKLADAGVENDQIDSVILDITGVKQIEHVQAGDGKKLIAALVQALNTRLQTKKKR